MLTKVLTSSNADNQGSGTITWTVSGGADLTECVEAQGDGKIAQALAIPGGGNTKNFWALDLNANIPTRSVINSVACLARCTASGPGLVMAQMNLLYSGSLFGDVHDAWLPAIGTSYDDYVLGGVDYDWGYPITYDVLNDATFGMRWKIRNDGVLGISGYMDYTSMTVYYECPAIIQGYRESHQNYARIVVTFRADGDGNARIRLDGIDGPKLLGTLDRIVAIPDVGNPPDDLWTIQLRHNHVYAQAITPQSGNDSDIYTLWIGETNNLSGDSTYAASEVRFYEPPELVIQNAGADTQGVVVLYHFT